MKNIEYIKTTKSIVFKSSKKEKGTLLTDVLLIVMIWLFMLCAVVFTLTKYQEYRIHFYMFAVCFMFVSYIFVIQIIDCFEKRDPQLVINEKGITLTDALKFKKILEWKDFVEIKMIPNVLEAGKGWPATYVCFSPKKVDDKEFRKNLYKISANLTKRRKVFEDNFIYIGFSEREAQIFFELCNEFISIYH